MRKKYFTFIFLGVLGLSFYLYYFRNANVFEEIYRDEYFNRAHWIGIRKPALESIPDIDVRQPRGTLYGMVDEKYQQEALPSYLDSLGYYFTFPNNKLEGGRVSVGFSFSYKKEDLILIFYTYEYKSNKLIRRIEIASDDRISDPSEVNKYIKENGIDLEPYYKKADDLLRNKVIPDWLRVYPSRFSKENWGNVKFVEE